jgi:hypothetical protein
LISSVKHCVRESNLRKARVAELRFFAFDPSKKRGRHQAPGSPDVERVALHDVLEPDVAPAVHPPLAGGDQSACD